MKKQTLFLAILLAAGLTSSRGQDTWTQKADFGGGIRELAVGFSIGSKGYIGTGFDSVLSDNKDFWEYTPGGGTPTPTPTGTPAGCTNYNTSIGTGTITPGDTDTGNHCDDCATFISLPFPVSVYGQTFNAANVASNGSFDLIGAQSVFSSDCPLPIDFWDMAILAYQYDLVTDQTPPDCVNFATGCGVFTSTTGTAPNRQFNIEWRAGYPFSSGTANFEVVFYEGQSSFFDVFYGITADNGLEEVSGVQASATGPATTFSCRTATLTNGLKVTYNCSGTPTPTPTATPTATPTPRPFQLRAEQKRVGGINTVRLAWQAATSPNIDIYRNNVLIATQPNDPGVYIDSTGDTGRARYRYRVCEAGTQTCSNEVLVRFPH